MVLVILSHKVTFTGSSWNWGNRAILSSKNDDFVCTGLTMADSIVGAQGLVISLRLLSAIKL